MKIPTNPSASDIARFADVVEDILREISSREDPTPEQIHAILRKHPRDGNSMFSKAQLSRIYRHLVDEGRMEMDEELLRRIRRKPIRTLSGVAPVTVLTKPYPCPGKCIFCPTDVRMPKSYLHDEPGAMRAEQHAFDPFDQTAGRIATLAGNGHAVDKIELLVLGGTWSSYPADYQEWFIQRCFDAMNGSESASLEQAHRLNESARHRNVGLVLETRQDHVTPREIQRLRRLGATKIQMGAQSLDDRVLAMNNRGHDVEATRRAMRLLRAAGFKLVLHWMPNLHGATLESDREDFARLFDDEALRPDELKIYSTALLENAELYDYYKRGEYRPYDESDLLELILDCKRQVPEYCRINRIYRDIPSTNIVEGSKMTNMRQHLHQMLQTRGPEAQCRCIRCREMRGQSWSELELVERRYRTTHGEELFLSYEDRAARLAGYVRLSLPDDPGMAGGESLGLPELSAAALIRELHVYGPLRELGRSDDNASQHRGLGKKLMAHAEEIARSAGYAAMAVISAVGTRPYYEALGYCLDGSYMLKRWPLD